MRRGALLKSPSALLQEGFTVLTLSENKQGAFQAILLRYGKALSLAWQISAVVCTHIQQKKQNEGCTVESLYSWQDYNVFHTVSLSV